MGRIHWETTRQVGPTMWALALMVVVALLMTAINGIVFDGPKLRAPEATAIEQLRAATR